MNWLAQCLRKVKFGWNQMSSPEKGKKSATCSLFPPALWGPLDSLLKLLTLNPPFTDSLL